MPIADCRLIVEPVSDPAFGNKHSAIGNTVTLALAHSRVRR